MPKKLKIKTATDSWITIDAPEYLVAGVVRDNVGNVFGSVEVVPSKDDLPNIFIGGTTEHGPYSELEFPIEFFKLNNEEFCFTLAVLVKHNRKIPAIKLLRRATKWGLKEAKDFVEWCYAEQFGEED